MPQTLKPAPDVARIFSDSAATSTDTSRQKRQSGGKIILPSLLLIMTVACIGHRNWAETEEKSSQIDTPDAQLLLLTGLAIVSSNSIFRRLRSETQNQETQNLG